MEREGTILCVGNLGLVPDTEKKIENANKMKIMETYSPGL